MYRYIKSSLEENEKFMNEYIDSLSSRYDNALEKHIIKSEVYSIYIGEKHSGYFGIHDSKVITQFFIPKGAFKHAQAIFNDVLKKYKIQNAFVPTCDEALLSLCLDKHCKVNLQAYFFEEGNESVAPAEYSRKLLNLATMDDLDEIKEITGDFTDNHVERIKGGQLYVLRENHDFLGLGIIEDNVIMRNCKATGMFTNEKHRQKGVGRSIILHLKDICHENNNIPLPGCWYFNYNSKRTLESAGYISKTRLLKIDFEGDYYG